MTTVATFNDYVWGESHSAHPISIQAPAAVNEPKESAVGLAEDHFLGILKEQVAGVGVRCQPAGRGRTRVRLRSQFIRHHFVEHLSSVSVLPKIGTL